MTLEKFKGGPERLYSLRHKLAATGVGILLCVVGYYAVFGANGLVDYQQKRRESRELDRQIKTLQEQNGTVEQEIKALKSDPKTIEKEARERLRYARPGEVIYTIPGNSAQPPSGKK